MESGRHRHTALKQFFLFKDVPEERLAEIGERMRERTFAKRSIIFTEGEEQKDVYFIVDGWVKVYKMGGQGNERIISILQKGDMFPHIGLLQQRRYPGTAEALEETLVLWMTREALRTLITTHQEIQLALWDMLEKKISDLQAQLSAALSGEVRQRLMTVLVHLSLTDNQKTGAAIRLPLTHQDLASMIGTTRETVNRVLNDLKKEQLIDYRRGEIRLLNVAALKQKMGQEV
ncbi:Crp/Fnr family transcriptional regulator [Hydrogenibacillus sp. N12]|uniref:Crp/Fnr family transcriptional regulator n=1 Tax=Hydrogenibacillus sp. N12 TaxID=2866627 RepID=UPI001C7DE3A5|nr:Crp/Fnr family transcriptional regulator [Hydrogenibacillus sp. N12]QZA33170.1 Crp/Fnr family transcriptional regulator [Hydrogenibacillus sp. N12]